MNRIIAKNSISENLVKFEIKTTMSLEKIKPGQYIVLTVEENQQGIALSVLKTNIEKESITVIAYVTDIVTSQLVKLNENSKIHGISGPYGHANLIRNFGTVFCIGREAGIVPLLPVLKSLRIAGNHIITILSAQTKEGIILERSIQDVSDKVIVITDDGSYGEKMSVCRGVGQVLNMERINQVFAFGDARTIKDTCVLSKRNNIQTQATLYLGKSIENGVHGIFKVANCNNATAICVDGFNFNAYYSDFNELVARFDCPELKTIYEFIS